MRVPDRKIICTHFSEGKKHDFKLFQESGLRFHDKAVVCLDLGYIGAEELHSAVCLPCKQSKWKTLSKADRLYNRTISRSRVFIENVIRSLKIFRIVAERYRNRRTRFELRMNLIAGIYNYELQN